MITKVFLCTLLIAWCFIGIFGAIVGSNGEASEFGFLGRDFYYFCGFVAWWVPAYVVLYKKFKA